MATKGIEIRAVAQKVGLSTVASDRAGLAPSARGRAGWSAAGPIASDVALVGPGLTVRRVRTTSRA